MSELGPRREGWGLACPGGSVRRVGASSMSCLGFRRPGVCSTVGRWGTTAGGLRYWWETRVDGGVGLTQAPAQLETEAASDTSKRAGRVGRV